MAGRFHGPLVSPLLAKGVCRNLVPLICVGLEMTDPLPGRVDKRRHPDRPRNWHSWP